MFSLFFLFYFYFLLKVHINFYISTFVLSKCYSSFVHATFRPFRNIQRATRISVCVTSVCNSHEFFVESLLAFLFLSTTTPAPSHQRVIFFSTTTQGIRLRRRVDVFQRRRTLQRVDSWRRRDIDFSLDSHFS